MQSSPNKYKIWNTFPSGCLYCVTDTVIVVLYYQYVGRSMILFIVFMRNNPKMYILLMWVLGAFSVGRTAR